jgi:hypothetical protein
VRLLGLLLGVGLVLGLTVFVMGKLDDQGKATAKSVGVTVLPGGVVVPAPDSPAVASGNAVSSALTVACASQAQALRGAEDQYQTLNGKYADVATLVSSGTIRPLAKALYAISSTDGFATYQLKGQQGCP